MRVTAAAVGGVVAAAWVGVAGAAAPVVRIVAHPPTTTASATATFAFAAPRPALCSLDAHAFRTCRSPVTYSNLAAGAHMFAVRAAGRSARWRWTVTAPVVVRIDAHPDSPSRSPDATFAFSADRDVVFRCALDGAAPVPCTSPQAYSQLANGSHTFAVAAGGGKPATFTWDIAASGQIGTAASALAAATSVAAAEQALRSFFAQYDMTLSVSNIQPSAYAQAYATWTPAGDGDLGTLKEYGAALIGEWAKYPVDWIHVTKVRGIALVKHLAVLGTSRGAMPDAGGSVMYYDIGYGSGAYAREIIHHEFDHLLTWNLTGTWAPSDPAWAALNPPGFAYGSGGASCYTGPCPSGPHAVVGFASGYATSAIEEDKAEIYGYLMESDDYRLLQSWLPSDPYLAAKVARYEQYLCGLAASLCGDYFAVANRG